MPAYASAPFGDVYVLSVEAVLSDAFPKLRVITAFSTRTAVHRGNFSRGGRADDDWQHPLAVESHPALLAARGGSAAFSCLVDTGLERLAAPQRLPASLWPSAHRPWRALLHFDCTLTDQLLLMAKAGAQLQVSLQQHSAGGRDETKQGGGQCLARGRLPLVTRLSRSEPAGLVLCSAPIQSPAVALHLTEWVEWHRMAGVQHVAVYVSSWRQGFRSFLGPHLARGAITALSFELPGLLGGVGGGGGAADHAGGGDGNDTAEARGTRLALAQAHCLTRHKDFAHWLLLLDLDDYMYVPGDEWAGIAQRGAEELHPKQAGWRLSSWRMTSSQPASGRGTQLPNWLAAERCRSAFLAPPSERNVSMLWTLASRYRSRARAKRAGGERLLILTARADAVTMGSVRVGMPVREIPAGAMRVHHLPAPWQQQREEEESARRMGSGGNGRGVRAWVSERGVLQLARLLAARVTPLLRRMDLPAELVEEALRSANAQAKQHSSGKQLVTVKLGVYAAPV